jgi:hypothetical protein
LPYPGVKPYQAEDFEKVMVNYFKALNYIRLGEYDEALVEARRITIKLHQLNDKYKDHKNRYSDDAFAHVMIGLIYDAGNDYNNAFIAYRNALEVYEEVYAKNFGLEAPEQLKRDILRTAYLTGFHDEVAYYENKFGVKYNHQEPGGGDLVFLWQNGFGPVKDEWSNALLRLATKRAMELAVREATAKESKEDKLDVGDVAPAAITLINAFTEKADTRNWQTLPYSISYTRIMLPEGKHNIRLQTSNGQHSNEQDFEFNIRKGKTSFFTFQSLETLQPGE